MASFINKHGNVPLLLLTGLGELLTCIRLPKYKRVLCVWYDGGGMSLILASICRFVLFVCIAPTIHTLHLICNLKNDGRAYAIIHHTFANNFFFKCKQTKLCPTYLILF